MGRSQAIRFNTSWHRIKLMQYVLYTDTYFCNNYTGMQCNVILDTVKKARVTRDESLASMISSIANVNHDSYVNDVARIIRTLFNCFGKQKPTQVRYSVCRGKSGQSSS